MTARHELQVELKKLEGDYELKLQDLSQEKEKITSLKLEKEKENQGLQQQMSTLQLQVPAQSVFFKYRKAASIVSVAHYLNICYMA